MFTELPRRKVFSETLISMVKLDDVAEPGKGKDTFKIQTDSGYAAAGSWKEGIFRSTASSTYNERSEQGREGFLRGPPSSPV
jgi:hypothetical protein